MSSVLRAPSVEHALFFQSVYGITLASDTEIPGISNYAPAAVHTRVHTGAMPEWLDDSMNSCARRIYPAADEADRSLIVHYIASPSAYCFQYDDGVRFVISRAADSLWMDWAPGATLAVAALYLLGPIMTWLLRLRGTPTLHASVVAVDGHAVLLLGGEGAGKSTTAAALAALGVPVLSDDLAPIDSDGILRCRSGYARLRLWPDSAHALFTSDALSPLAEGWDKLALDLHQNDMVFEPRSLPLGAVYLLDERSDAETAPRVQALSPREALLGLVANSAAGPLLDTRMRAEELALLGRIVREVPVRSIVPHTSLARLPELCDLLLRDARELIP